MRRRTRGITHSVEECMPYQVPLRMRQVKPTPIRWLLNRKHIAMYAIDRGNVQIHRHVAAVMITLEAPLTKL